MESVETKEIVDLDSHTIEELREMLTAKESELVELEKVYGDKRYLVEGGMTFIRNLKDFLEHDVQVSWKGTQANGVIKLMEVLDDIHRKLTVGDESECMLDAQSIYLINLFIMNTVTTGYSAAVRVQKLYEPLITTFSRYQQDASVINMHVETMNSLYRHINQMELEEQAQSGSPDSDEL